MPSFCPATWTDNGQPGQCNKESSQCNKDLLLMKIYTKTGDSGQTSLVGAERIAKNSPRIEAIGTIDELNSHVGVIRSIPIDEDLDRILGQIQHDLFQLGAITATPANPESKTGWLDNAKINHLENVIDQLEQSLTPLKNFILPSGVSAATATHLARAVCRRSERRLLTLLDETSAGEPENTGLKNSMIYLNRLSDLLFVLARIINSRANHSETIWKSK